MVSKSGLLTLHSVLYPRSVLLEVVATPLTLLQESLPLIQAIAKGVPEVLTRHFDLVTLATHFGLIFMIFD